MPERDHLQCDPTTLQTKNGRGGVNIIYGKGVESVTPAKLCVTLLLRNYIVRLKSDGHEDTGNVENMRSGIVNSSTNVDHVDDVAPWLNSHRSNIPSGIDANIHRPPPSARERKAFCVLAIQLIQGIDLPLQDLMEIVDPSKINENRTSNKIKAKNCGTHFENSRMQQVHSDVILKFINRKSTCQQNFGVSSSLFDEWKKDMAKIVSEGVGGLMDLSVSLEKMVSHEKRLQDDINIPLLHRASVVGLFLRRIILCFDKLNFSEVSHLYHNFKEYYEQGTCAFPNETGYLGNKSRIITESLIPSEITTPHNANETTSNTSITSSLPSTSTPDLDSSSYSAEVSNINIPQYSHNQCKPLHGKGHSYAENENDLKNMVLSETHTPFIPSRLTRTQAELYIANQVELLQTTEAHAHSPEEIEKVVDAILTQNPDLGQAHFLAYLNCLRVKDYCDAINHLNQCFSGTAAMASSRNPSDPMLSGSSANLEDCNRGFRYAALNLAAVHARFNHKEEASAALREAVMMAQESNDHICLQHALSWLYRIQPESERLKLIERCISKSQELGLSYLQSLGEQAMSLLTSMIGLSGPSAIMDILTRSDMLNCQHSIIELVTSSYSQKSAFWSMYGRSHMSSMVSQLLLNLDNSGSRAIGSKRGSDAVYATGEATAISIANLIRQLHDLGQEKLVDKLFDLAKSLFGNESSICGEIWRYTSLQVEFERSLHQTNWSKAASTIVEAEAFSTTGSYAHSRSYSDTNIPFEALFMKLQLNIYRGDAEAAATVRKMMHQHVKSDNENDKINPHQQVRLLILDAELSCLTNCYPNAIPHLIEAASICDKNFMQFHKAMIFLHTAHIQLQFGLASRALDLVNRCLPIIFAHGSRFECGRAKLLLAKCLVASAERENILKEPEKNICTRKFSAEGRADVHKAKKHLESAKRDFIAIGAYGRAKDVLYLMARLSHELGLFQERNQTSAEFKKLEEQQPTHSSSVLATML